MFGFIEKAIDEVQYVIPEEVLRLAFTFRQPYQFHGAVSIPVMIREQVIDRRVRQDIDLKGLTKQTIPLAGLEQEWLDKYNLVIRIPMERTNGRSISSCISLVFGQVGSYGFNYGLAANNFTLNGENARSVLTDGLNNLAAAVAPIPQVSTANVKLIGENTILVTDVIPFHYEFYLNCLMAGDSELSQITPPYYNLFAEFVVLATKAFVYRKLNIALDEAALIGGQALGRIREVVDSYSDAEQSYQDFRKEKLSKLLVLNDRERMRNITKMLVGGNN